MALKIRLTRLGDKGNPFYRVIVAESRSPRDGKFIDIIGTFDPKAADAKDGIKLDREKATEWLSKGANPTDTARVVLEKAGILEKSKVTKKPTKTTAAKPAKKEKTKK